MKNEIMILNNGRCVVCGGEKAVMNVGTVVDSNMTPAKAEFYGVPAGRAVQYFLCDNHYRKCVHGSGIVSGLPDSATLEKAIRKAIANFDYQPENDRRGAYLDNLHKLHIASKQLEKAGHLAAAAKVVFELVGAMEAEEEPQDQLAPYWQALAKLDLETGNAKRAKTYLEKARDFYAGQDRHAELSEVLVQLGEACNELKQFATARGYLRTALNHFEAQGRPDQVALTLRKIGVALIGEGDGVRAAECFAKAEALETSEALKRRQAA